MMDNKSDKNNPLSVKSLITRFDENQTVKTENETRKSQDGREKSSEKGKTKTMVSAPCTRDVSSFKEQLPFTDGQMDSLITTSENKDAKQEKVDLAKTEVMDERKNDTDDGLQNEENTKIESIPRNDDVPFHRPTRAIQSPQEKRTNTREHKLIGFSLPRHYKATIVPAPMELTSQNSPKEGLGHLGVFTKRDDNIKVIKEVKSKVSRFSKSTESLRTDSFEGNESSRTTFSKGFASLTKGFKSFGQYFRKNTEKWSADISKSTETLARYITRRSTETLSAHISKSTETLARDITRRSTETLSAHFSKSTETLARDITRSTETLSAHISKTTETLARDITKSTESLQKTVPSEFPQPEHISPNPKWRNLTGLTLHRIFVYVSNELSQSEVSWKSMFGTLVSRNWFLRCQEESIDRCLGEVYDKDKIHQCLIVWKEFCPVNSETEMMQELKAALTQLNFPHLHTEIDRIITENETMGNPLTTNLESRHLMDLAGELSNDWTVLGIMLGFSSNRLNQFSMDNPKDIKMTIFNMLEEWRKASNGHVGQFVKALTKMKRLDLVDSLKTVCCVTVENANETTV